MVRMRLSSNLSPWLAAHRVGDVFHLPFGGGDSRLVMRQQIIDQLAEQGQIAGQFVDWDGVPTSDIRFNPSGSVDAILALTSPDGRIFGISAYPERCGEQDLYRNFPKGETRDLFAGAVAYFQ